ncbi:MAG: YfcC family protein [Chloroflexi bacterium]|jgi:uncharacterized ion transporter superfamily protein YfcC|nr:YfcC family protein [Chloroflexota bacterium]
MAESKSGAQISTKAFLQALLIIFALMILSGILTRVIPSGQFIRIEEPGRGEVIDPNAFSFTDQPKLPVWRWFTAPVEVFFSPDGFTIAGIIIFILLVGVAFAVLERSGILNFALATIVQRFGEKKYTLLLVLTFFFMALGGFFGILEEVVPLVPIMIALAYSLGWDSLTGLGMSVLAANVGFSTAVFNFFTIGIAQQLAGLPLFSGWAPRLVLFLAVYALLALFLTRHAKKVAEDPSRSPVYIEDRQEKPRLDVEQRVSAEEVDPRQKRAAIFMATCFGLILVVVMVFSWVEGLNDLAMPLSGLLFLVGGVGAGLIAGIGKDAWKAAWDGFLGIAPAIPLLMMAASIKLIISSGGILDTMLYAASQRFSATSPLVSALVIYAVTLVLELFVSSGSAKALLIIPLIAPLADLVGVSRQIAVSAFAFGDGFSNLVYPTNAVLLIALSLTAIPYHKWLKWVLRLWAVILPVTVIFLALAVMFNYGPF